MAARVDSLIADDDDASRSLTERATQAARAELRGERTSILGATGETALPPLARGRRVPEHWSFIAVMDRMEEAFRTLGRLPMATRPRGYVNSMPFYLEESRKLMERRHADSSAALRDLAEKLDKHAAAVEVIRPTVAALELSRSKLATFASLGLTAFVVIGWFVEAGLKLAVDRILAHVP
jgi:hypothetical protein